MSSGGSNEPAPTVKQKTKKVIKVKRVVYDPTFVPMPNMGEANGTTTNGDGETSEAGGTSTNGDGETVGELYVEGTYNDEVEYVIDRPDRFVIRPDGGNGYVFIILFIYLCIICVEYNNLT
jgi:hypothetical protein